MRLAAATVAAVCLTACTGSSGPEPSPTPTSPSPTPSATTPVAQRLQQLAAMGNKAVFHGSYLVRQRHPSSHATWRVWRTKRSLRVDVVTKHVTATLISTPRATYSCRRSGHRKTCFRVAKGDQPIPVPVRLSAEQLFSTDLDRLANHPNSYKVAQPAAGSVPVRTNGGECFRVTVPKKSKTHLDSAIYCLSAAGIINAVVYRSGNIVRVQSVKLRAPNGHPFHPYSSPTPLPG